MSVSRGQIDAYCEGLPGARPSGPGELVSWKVGDRMFACFGDFADMGGVSVKTADVETAAMLIDAGAAERAPYFHRSWIRFAYDTADAAEVRYRLGQSYDIVRAGLKKAVRDRLARREDD